MAGLTIYSYQGLAILEFLIEFLTELFFSSFAVSLVELSISLKDKDIYRAYLELGEGWIEGEGVWSGDDLRKGLAIDWDFEIVRLF